MKEKTVDWLGIVAISWAGVVLIYCILQLGIIKSNMVITVLSMVGLVVLAIYYLVQDAKCNKIEERRVNRGLEEMENMEKEREIKDKEAGRFLGLATVIDEQALCRYITKAIAEKRILIDDRAVIKKDGK